MREIFYLVDRHQSMIRDKTIITILICLAVGGCSSESSTPMARNSGSELFEFTDPMSGERASPETGARIITQFHDFGLVGSGEKRIHRFRIRNDSEVPWNCADVSTSCGCTAGVLSSDRILPGEQTEIDVSFRASRKTGNRRASVKVKFTEVVAPHVELFVEAKVRREITVRRDLLNFGSVGVDQPVTLRFIVDNFGDQSWSAINFQNPKHLPITFSASRLASNSVDRMRDTGDPFERWEVTATVRIAKTSPDELFVHDAITVCPAGSGSASTESMSVSYSAEPAIQIIPRAIFFGDVGRGITVDRKILLRSARDFKEAVGTLQLSHDIAGDLVPEIGKSERNFQEVELSLTVPDDAVSGPNHGTLYIKSVANAFPDEQVSLAYNVVEDEQ